MQTKTVLTLLILTVAMVTLGTIATTITDASAFHDRGNGRSQDYHKNGNAFNVCSDSNPNSNPLHCS